MKVLFTIVLVLLLVLAASSVIAQDETLVPTVAQTFEPTVVPTAVPTADPIEVINTAENVTTIISGTAVAIITGFLLGAGSVLATFTLALRYVRANARIMNAIESEFMKQPQTTQEQTRKIIGAIDEGVELAKDLTDGKLQ